jgi:hypothetical protein
LRDEPQDVGEEIFRDSNLGHLEGDVAPEHGEKPFDKMMEELMAEACARLDAQQIPHSRCADHVRIGALTYYPRSGTIHLDGATNSFPDKGFAYLLRIVRGLSGIKTSGAIF